jgi:hypothetical protein
MTDQMIKKILVQGDLTTCVRQKDYEASALFSMLIMLKQLNYKEFRFIQQALNIIPFSLNLQIFLILIKKN